MLANAEAQKVDELTKGLFDELKPPGLLCAVIADRKTAHVSSYGVADTERRAAWNIDGSFPIGSLTKSFAAASILVLRDEGRISLDQSPRQFIPELGAEWQGVTLWQLLSMQSGLGEDFGGSWAEQHLPLSNHVLTERFSVPITWAARHGAQYFYSNFGYMVLGRVISKASGQDARDFIAQRLLEPLGMERTSWSVPSANVVRGYRTENNKRFEEEGLFSAANDGAVFGGLWSCVPDMARWIDFLACAHGADDEKYEQILDRSSRLEMQRAAVLRPITTPDRPEETPLTLGYALGLVNFPSRSEWTVGHGGAVPGFGCHMRWSPSTGVGVFAVANLRYADLSEGCGRILAAARERVPARAIPLHPLVAARGSELLSLLREWDSAVAERLFAMNFFIDYPREQTAEKFSQLRQRYAQQLSDAQVVQLPGLSAKILIREEQLMSFTVSGLEPGQVQEVVF
jgi:CubicO group peptidase (beta-lactamase class C family)